MPEYPMLFAVAVPRPLPYVAKIALLADGSIGGPPEVRGMLLTLGAASVFYGLAVDDLRERWIRAAVASYPTVRAGNCHRWGVTVEEWNAAVSAVNPPPPRPSEDRARWSSFLKHQTA